jgi:hypothetical protein
MRAYPAALFVVSAIVSVVVIALVLRKPLRRLPRMLLVLVALCLPMMAWLNMGGAHEVVFAVMSGVSVVSLVLFFWTARSSSRQ